MLDQYNENEYDQRAKQSGQEFRNQALNTGYDYFKKYNGNTTAKAANNAVGNASTTAASAGNSATGAGTAATAGGTTATAAAETATAGGAAAAAGAGGAGTVAGTAVAAGAPTGGIGALVVLALAAFKVGIDKANAEGADIGQVTDINKESRHPFFLFCAIGLVVALCCIILLIPSCAMFFPQLMERDRKENIENQQGPDTSTVSQPFFTAHSDKNEFFKQVLGIDSYNVTANNIVQEYRQIDNTNIGIFKAIIDHAIWNAFNKHSLSYCSDYDLMASLDFMADKDMTFEDKINYILFFDAEAALENYRSKKYPYTATHDNGFYYTIGDYLDGKIPDDELNNLLNYAEIITVLSQSEDCSANNFSYSSFYDMLTSKETEMLLFEIKFDKERTWSHEVIEESSAENGDLDSEPEPDNTSGSIPTSQEKSENAAGQENMENSETAGSKNNSITIEPVTPDKTIINSDPKKPPITISTHEKDKGDNTVKDKNTPSNDASSKIKPVEPSKNKGNKSNSTISSFRADTIPLKFMAFPRKLFRVVLLPADLGIGGSPAQPTPAPQPTSTPTPDQEGASPDAGEDDNLTEEVGKSLIYKYGFYYDCEIAPYGLLELYTIAGTDPNDMNANEYTMRNIDVLDISERWLRAKISDVSLGLDARSPMQYLDSNLISKGIEGLFSSDIYYKHAVGLRDQLTCNYVPDGQSVILEMQSYINQGKYPDNYRGTDGRGQSIKAAGCCDCSYAMIAMYLNRANYDIVSISRTYVSNNNFRGKDFLNSVGLKEDVRDGAYSASSVIGYLTEGLPVMLHISGKWVYNGITYHGSTNGHFLVIMGFDDVGFYVYDPGSNQNTTNGPIPYAAFSHVAGKSIRVISRKSTFMPHYLVNTYLD